MGVLCGLELCFFFLGGGGGGVVWTYKCVLWTRVGSVLVDLSWGCAAWT